MIAYMSYIAGKPRVYLFDHGNRPAGDAGQFPQYDVLAALLARRQQGRHVAGAGRQFRHLCDGSAHARGDAADHRSGASTPSPSFSPDGKQITFESDRGGSQQIYVMNADGSNCASHQLRRRQERHAGLEPARRPDRLHQAGRRRIPHRRHAPRRLGRAHASPTAGRTKARPGRPMAVC